MINETERARAALAVIPPNLPRDEWVKAGMAAKSAGLTFDDFHDWSATAGNYSGENECRTVWKSFNGSGGVTPASLFHMAYAQGWKDPARTTHNERNDTRPDIPPWQG